MSDNSAKVLAITAVWVCTALIFVFGVFDFNWRGGEAVVLMLLISVAICIAAAYATKKICDSFASNTSTSMDTSQQER